MMCARGAGEIIGVLMKCNVRENREREGFLGVSGNAECIRWNEFERRQERREICDKQRIARAASGDDQFFRAADTGKDKFGTRLRDGSGGEGGCGVN